ncbi:MAG: Crp/Fnr family transcriptional regulator [Gammaproteobacteria bacterium]|nr:Crp/Fnr family transcriptional regulator [Gammaproteobacteria bacterium]
MPDLTTRAILEHNFLFHGLPDSTITALAEMAHRKQVGKESMLFCQGDECDGLYGVASGRVRIFASDPNGHEIFLNILGPGETIGEISLIDGLPRSASAVAIEPSTLVHIPRRRFFAYLEHDTKLSLHLMQLFCDRLRWVSDLVEESAFLTGAGRLANRLVSLLERFGRPLPDGSVELRISQLELSHFLGISRQVVNQHLGQMSNDGWISTERGKIVVRDLAAIKGAAQLTDTVASHA